MTAADRFRLAVAQITSGDNIMFNLQQIEKLYVHAAAERADLVVFPENSLYFRIRTGDSTVGLKWGGPEMAGVQELVDRNSVAMMLTTALETVSGKLSNTTLLFQPRRMAKKIYSKVHLFDVDVIGSPPVRESDAFAPGQAPQVVEIKGWKFGLSICYDLRFAELYLHYAQKVDVILVPSAFLVPTGEAHWHVLLRARAIENQCFVAAPAQSGEHHSGTQVRKTYGHSLVVDPWGKIITELKESPEIRVVELNKEAIGKVRSQIPMSAHRRL